MARRLFWATVALLALTGTLRADIPPGPSPLQPGAPLPLLPPQFARPEVKKARLVFRFDGPDAQTRLRLPSSLLKTPLAEAPAPMRGAWLAPTRPSLVAAGLALTLSAVTAGLWLTRWRDRRVLGGGVLLVSVVLLGVSGCPWNNDVRWEYHEGPVGTLNCCDDGTLAGQALLEAEDGIDSVQLFINRDDLTKFADRPVTPK